MTSTAFKLETNVLCPWMPAFTADRPGIFSLQYASYLYFHHVMPNKYHSTIKTTPSSNQNDTEF